MSGNLVISLDFELAWGVHGLQPYLARIVGGRRAIRTLLELFEAFEVHATWAAVGFVMCGSRDELERYCPEAPPYRKPSLSTNSMLTDVGPDEVSDPLHFGASLVEAILQTPGQELGTHTFSHYYCLEEGPSLDDFDRDLGAAQSLAKNRWGVELRSVVFPRNQVSEAHLAVCAHHGLYCYRGNPAGWFHAPAPSSGQTPARRALRLADAYLPLSRGTPRPATAPLIDVPASAFLRPWSPSLAFAEPLRKRRLLTALRSAAATGSDFHLWWHPHNFGAHLGENLEFLTDILRAFSELREQTGMESLTMYEAAQRRRARAAS